MFVKGIHTAVIAAVIASAASGASAQVAGPIPSFGPDIHCVYTVTKVLPSLPVGAQLPIQVPAEREVFEFLVQRDRVTASVTRFPGYALKIAPRKEILVSEQGVRRVIASWDTEQRSFEIKDRATGGARFYLLLSGPRRSQELRALVAGVLDKPRHSAACRTFPEGSFGTL